MDEKLKFGLIQKLKESLKPNSATKAKTGKSNKPEINK